MEISTRHLVCSTATVQVGWNQLQPDQSSCGAHDLKGNSINIVNIANPCSKLLCTEVNQMFRKQALYV